jgi:hypothetical protein
MERPIIQLDANARTPKRKWFKSLFAFVFLSPCLIYAILICIDQDMSTGYYQRSGGLHPNTYFRQKVSKGTPRDQLHVQLYSLGGVTIRGFRETEYKDRGQYEEYVVIRPGLLPACFGDCDFVVYYDAQGSVNSFLILND